ncbi:MAG TPA: hypothetical protein VHX86_02290 [Tepidisphaeraceae bacterium]|jgi:hypothetical protein|nr:hypothetical protein [Tepidisphaeraceae bacterium]
MVKYTGLGIACLTLVLSGVTRASQICIDNGNDGKSHNKCVTDDKCNKNDKNCDNKQSDDKCFKLDDCKVIDKNLCSKNFCSDDKNLKDCKDDKSCKEDKDCKDGKKDKDKDCKIEWTCNKHDHISCDQDNQNGNHCDLVTDGCDHNNDGCKPDGCCASVPIPASSAMGGAGLFGIALMTFIRSRRSIAA